MYIQYFTHFPPLQIIRIHAVVHFGFKGLKCIHFFKINELFKKHRHRKITVQYTHFTP